MWSKIDFAGRGETGQGGQEEGRKPCALQRLCCEDREKADLVIGGVFDGEDVEGDHDPVDGQQHRLTPLVNLQGE